MSDMVSYSITAWEQRDAASEFTLNSRFLANDQVLIIVMMIIIIIIIRHI